MRAFVQDNSTHILLVKHDEEDVILFKEGLKKLNYLSRWML